MIVINARFLTQPITGVQRFAIELSLKLKKLDNSVQFVCPKNVIHEEIFNKLGAKIVGNREGHYWEQTDLPSYLNKTGKPLLVNLANTGPVFYKNKIITLHDVAFNVFPKTYSRTFLYFYKISVPLLTKTSRHIITVSDFSKKEIQRFYNVSEDKIKVIHNAVDDIFEQKEDVELQKVRYFLVVSTTNYRKNLLSILEAFDKLSNRIQHVKLFLIGDVQTKNFAQLDLEKYLANDNVNILGRVSDSELIRYYSNALAFLYPSLYEGFGIPPLEAQKCGCPVLLSNVSCFPEIFNDSVLYCNPYSSESIKEGMLLLLENKSLREALMKKGQVNAQKYSWGKSAMILSDLIKTINT